MVLFDATLTGQKKSRAFQLMQRDGLNGELFGLFCVKTWLEPPIYILALLDTWYVIVIFFILILIFKWWLLCMMWCGELRNGDNFCGPKQYLCKFSRSIYFKSVQWISGWSYWLEQNCYCDEEKQLNEYVNLEKYFHYRHIQYLIWIITD